MGVAFAEVSPDFCFCINSHRHCGAVFIAPNGLWHCDAGGLYVGRVGVGPAKRLYLQNPARLAGRALWPAAGVNAVYAAGVPQ